MKSIKLFMPILLILLAVSTCYSLPSNWTYTNTGNNHIVLIQPTSVITVNGASLTPGDYLGVFYLDNGNLICGGYVEWTGNITAIAAWGDDSYTAYKDGFSIGETFNWKIWSSTSNLEYNATVTYMAGFPNQGTYVINGTSGIATAMSSSSIVVNSTKPSCFGLSDGVINIVVTSGTPPYTFAWSNGATTQNIANIPSGVYGITVTDVSQTSDSLMIRLAQPDLLEASVLVNEDSAFMCMAHA
ncbi:MAG: SprB repeat-containing protein, partial [Bacteroidales bacterium]|nr:SprB repeat-containing protein [Bacteroidales bacterium]